MSAHSTKNVRPGADPRVVKRAADVLERALAAYDLSQKSKHWDVFTQEHLQRIADLANWSQFRYNGLTAGFDVGWNDPSASGKPPIVAQEDTRRAEPIRRRYESLRSVVGSEFIATYAEAEIGDPERLYIDGVPANIADLRLLHDAWDIQRLFADRAAPRTALEIGGGFGGMTAKIHTLFPTCRCIILDLPEVNPVQQVYLAQRFPEARILDYIDLLERGPEALLAEDWTFAILPAWCAKDVPPGSLDLAVNTRSMMEMTNATVAGYFDLLHRAMRVGGVFYCVNRYWKGTAGEAVQIKDYPFDARWAFALSAPGWDQDWLHRLAAVRLDFDSAIPPREQLRDLPPASWRRVGEHARALLSNLRRVTLGGHRNIEAGLSRRLFLVRRAVERKGLALAKRLLRRGKR